MTNQFHFVVVVVKITMMDSNHTEWVTYRLDDIDYTCPLAAYLDHDNVHMDLLVDYMPCDPLAIYKTWENHSIRLIHQCG